MSNITPQATAAANEIISKWMTGKTFHVSVYAEIIQNAIDATTADVNEQYTKTSVMCQELRMESEGRLNTIKDKKAVIMHQDQQIYELTYKLQEAEKLAAGRLLTLKGQEGHSTSKTEAQRKHINTLISQKGAVEVERDKANHKLFLMERDMGLTRTLVATLETALVEFHKNTMYVREEGPQ